WPDPNGPLAKVKEELAELERETGEGKRERLEDEIGDLLFAVVNLARKLAIDPRAALERANDKFTRRFEAMEQLAEQRGIEIGRATLDELDRLWDEVKGQSLQGSNSSAPAITTMSGRRTCSTSTVGPCAASTSGSRRYTCGLSSVPPPRRITFLRSTHSSIISRETAPGLITCPRRVRLPAAAVRLITRPAPCTVEYSARACSSRTAGSSDATPWMITASSPIEPPTKPFWPGNAGVAPLPTT